MTEPSSPEEHAGDPTTDGSHPAPVDSRGAGGGSTVPPGQHPLPHRPWDLTRSALAAGGVLAVVLAATASGPWFPLGRSELDTRTTVFGFLALVLVIIVQGGILAYLSGRWRAIWAWVVGGVVITAGALVGLNLGAGALPAALEVPIPRTAVLVAGVLLVVIALSRDSDTVHERHTEPDDWFKITGRILQAVHFWTAEQATEQMRLAHAEFDRVQSRRGHGDPELTPTEVFGTPDEYAASVRQRPAASTDPLRAGRWYYLTTAIALGAWAGFRALAASMNWLTVLLFVFAAVAFGMFLWASLTLRRHR